MLECDTAMYPHKDNTLEPEYAPFNELYGDWNEFTYRFFINSAFPIWFTKASVVIDTSECPSNTEHLFVATIWSQLPNQTWVPMASDNLIEPTSQPKGITFKFPETDASGNQFKMEHSSQPYLFQFLYLGDCAAVALYYTESPEFATPYSHSYFANITAATTTTGDPTGQPVTWNNGDDPIGFNATKYLNPALSVCVEKLHPPPSTRSPTKQPTKTTTGKPTKRPTPIQTKKPTKGPTAKPIKQPTQRPTRRPTKQPVSSTTVRPTLKPTSNHIKPTIEG
ncbi:hypothetical protein RFI_11658 [Reticulomyxa filosa]|uniref:Uncharacterized protein n=1 Tax=Reticulomyxa filosa TaxID=46433 RepID=X6NGN9_RETFI|nr:hypothetical protein RFI_11658 [Reticulomyxa filosa]|eukprot:ETO25480.1 hypothetical protein RFI_11658 [Reticulomyxa filosa]